LNKAIDRLSSLANILINFFGFILLVIQLIEFFQFLLQLQSSSFW